MMLVSILGGWRATSFAFIAAVLFASGAYDRHRANTAEQALTNRIAQDNAAEVSANLAARTRELELTNASASISKAYEDGKYEAQQVGERVADDLRNDAVRLRSWWTGCEAGRLSDSARASSQFNAAAENRAKSAGRIVSAAHECDAQVIALQGLVKNYAGPSK